jgi:hypothetical protein
MIKHHIFKQPNPIGEMDCEFLNVSMALPIPKLSTQDKQTLEAAVTAVILKADAELLEITITNKRLVVLLAETNMAVLQERKIHKQIQQVINKYRLKHEK